MTVSYKPAKRENVPLLIGIDGASGSGKTYSAHLIAAGIADEIGRVHGRDGLVFGIDTERGRMLHYADHFRFMHANIDPPFRPSAYGDAIAAADAAGADVIIIDSFSHEWEGEGGVREWAKDLEDGGKKPPANWIEPKQAHKRLVNQMLAARAHVIVCMRSEEKMKVEAVPQLNNDGTPKIWNNKPSMKAFITPAADIPLLQRWVPICEKRFPYEITTSMLLVPDQPGVPIPRKLQEQHRPFLPEGQRITREAGASLARWAMGGGGSSRDSGDAAPSGELEFARATCAEAASRGTEALRQVWTSDALRRHQKALEGELDGWKQAAQANDRLAVPAAASADGDAVI